MLEAAELGQMPAEIRGFVDEFAHGISSAGFTPFPVPGTLTTLKMRTRFQAQAAKEGEIAAVHKDFVVVPQVPHPSTTTP